MNLNPLGLKHPQHIICVPASVVAHRVNGMVDYTLNGSDLMIGQREILEDHDGFRQVLSIAAFVCNGKVWAYQRRKGIGEDRLVGKTTVAVGGHWDIKDIIHVDSVIDIDASIKVALERELDEEVKLGANIVSVSPMDNAICADDTPVDRKHMAIMSIIEIDSESIVSKEVELEALGFFDPQELLDSDYDLETWGRVICEQLIKMKK